MNKPGYTLIELLIVISIMATLMTIGSFGISNFSKARGVSTGVTLAQQYTQAAKETALTRPSRSRLLIHGTNDPTNTLHRERYLRYMVIQVLNAGPDEQLNTDDDFWEIAQKGKYLPNRAWFIPSLSNQTDLIIPTVDARLPGQPDGETSTCFYYEFNTQGLLTDPKPGVLAPRFVISGGSLPPGTVEPIRSDDDRNVGGFVIWKKGTTSRIKHPDQIGL